MNENPHADRLHEGHALLAAGKPAAALDAAHAVLAVTPDDADGLHLAGMALTMLGRRGEALAVYARGHDLMPGAEGIACNMAGLLREMGRDADAGAVYRTLLKTCPRSTEALLGLTLSTAPRDDDLPDTLIHQLLDDDGLAADKRTALLFAKANRHHWQGNYGAAILGYREANAYQRERDRPYDLDAYAQVARMITQDLTDQVFAGAGHWGSDSTVPVFVAGLPRSGKTTLESMITGHEAVHGAGELRLLQDTAAEIEKKMTEAGPVRQLHRGTIDFRARTFLAELRRRAPAAERIIDTNVNNLLLLGFAALMFPRAPIIYCRREGMDIGLACYTARFAGTQLYSTDLHDTGRFIRLGQDMWDHWKTAVPNPVLEVNFRDLTEQPDDTARQVYGFLGLDGPVPDGHAGRQATGIKFQAAAYESHLNPLRDALTGGDTDGETGGET